MNRILRGLSANSGKHIKAGQTLIFLDEAQDVPHCMESLKYFCENAKEQHVVAAGSLLGLINHEGESYPVGKVNTLCLHPMSFEEFLIAMGHGQLADAITKCDWPVISALAPKLEDLLRQYCFVGGMPEVVGKYIESEDLAAIRRKQREILADYDSDISKHAGKETQRVRMVWKSMPAQLAKENRKFMYGIVRKGGRARISRTRYSGLWILAKYTRCTDAQIHAFRFQYMKTSTHSSFSSLMWDCLGQ